MSDKKAFTFIELIIAVTIFSIIAVSIYATLGAGIRIWLRTNPLIEAHQEMRTFFDMISNDAKRSFIYTYPDGGIKFDGKPKRVSFMTIAAVSGPDVPLHDEMVKVIYAFNEETKAVERTAAGRNEAFDERYARPEEIIRQAGDRQFVFEYCYAGTSVDEPYLWKESWEDEDKIPRAIRIRVGDLTKVIFIPAGQLGGGE